MIDKEDFSAQRREHSEPWEKTGPVPKLLLVTIAALFIWGIYYIVTTDLRNPAALGDVRIAADFEVDENAEVDAAALYMASCVACHQANGSGIAGVFPPLADSEWVVRKPEVLTQILLHGVMGELVVKGNTYNGVMPEFGTRFNDDEMAALVSYLRTNFGNSESTVDAAFVAEQRAATQDRTTPWQGSSELEAMEE